MFLRTLLFLVVMYFLVKLISRLFLSSGQKKQRRGPNFFIRTMQQMARQQQQQRQNQQQRSRQSDETNAEVDSSQRFAGIEEAEFEEITEEEKSTGNSSD